MSNYCSYTLLWAIKIRRILITTCFIPGELWRKLSQKQSAPLPFSNGHTLGTSETTLDATGARRGFSTCSSMTESYRRNFEGAEETQRAAAEPEAKANKATVKSSLSSSSDITKKIDNGNTIPSVVFKARMRMWTLRAHDSDSGLYDIDVRFQGRLAGVFGRLTLPFTLSTRTGHPRRLRKQLPYELLSDPKRTVTNALSAELLKPTHRAVRHRCAVSGTSGRSFWALDFAVHSLDADWPSAQTKETTTIRAALRSQEDGHQRT
ncbi:hypothetical protein PAXINDRAFT_155221 [Paxillus involutus ATCC 200175]|nr:hypothetical protein PAXINDRAFT_155221 [Paxillus involutus ATCC 200175]